MIDKNKLRKFLISIKDEATKQVSPLSFNDVKKIIINLKIEKEIIDASIEILKQGHYVTPSCIETLMVLDASLEKDRNPNKEEKSTLNEPVKRIEKKIISSEITKDHIKQFMKSNKSLMVEIRNYFSKNEIYLVKQINWINFIERRGGRISEEDQEMIIRIFTDMGIFSKKVEPYEFNEIEDDYVVEDIVEEEIIEKSTEEVSEDDENLMDIINQIIINLFTIKESYDAVDEEDVLINTLNFYDEIKEFNFDFSEVLNLTMALADKRIGITGRPISLINSIVNIMNYLNIEVVTIPEVIELLKNYSYGGKNRVFKEPTLRRLMNSHSIETYGNEVSYRNDDPRYFWKPSPSTYELIDRDAFIEDIDGMNEKEIEKYINILIKNFKSK